MILGCTGEDGTGPVGTRLGDKQRVRDVCTTQYLSACQIADFLWEAGLGWSILWTLKT